MPEEQPSDFRISRSIIPDAGRAEYQMSLSLKRTLKKVDISVTETRKTMTWIFEQESPEGVRQLTRSYSLTATPGPVGTYEVSGDEMDTASCQGDVDTFLQMWGTRMLTPEQLNFLKDLMSIPTST